VVATRIGTVRWALEDDQGRVHSWDIPNTYYNAAAPFRLLSPQHWAQTTGDGRGTWCATYHDAVDLFWDKNKFSRSIPLSTATNISMVRSAPTYRGFSMFCQQVAAADTPLNEKELLAYNGVVTDDEGTDGEQSDSEEDDDVNTGQVPATRRHPDVPDSVFPDKQLPDNTFEQTDEERAEVRRHVIPDEPELLGLTPQAELLSWHYRLGHLSFERIREMAARGDLPARL
jgi:hypothetical protein